jgi:SAM-dependent methyltransferase
VAAELDAQDDEPWPYTRDDFRRLDESADATFYESARFVHHVDEPAVQSIRDEYRRRLDEAVARLRHAQSGGGNGGSDAAPAAAASAGPRASRAAADATAGRALDILDIGASWDSFLPAGYVGDASASRVVGVGLNRDELAANRQLTEWRVQDLNAQPSLAWLPTDSFDFAVCTVSVDYLTQPRELFGEVARVLRPGAPFVVVFSDRIFFSKAVALWTGRSDLDHIDTVGTYFRFARPPRAVVGTPTGAAAAAMAVQPTRGRHEGGESSGGQDDETDGRPQSTVPLFGPPIAARIDSAPRRGVDPVYVVAAAARQ